MKSIEEKRAVRVIEGRVIEGRVIKGRPMAVERVVEAVEKALNEERKRHLKEKSK